MWPILKTDIHPPPFFKISSKGIEIATSEHGCFEHGCSITSKLRTECFPVFMHKAWTTARSQNTSLGAGETVVSKRTHVLDTVGRLEPHLQGWTIEEKTWPQVEGETPAQKTWVESDQRTPQHPSIPGCIQLQGLTWKSLFLRTHPEMLRKHTAQHRSSNKCTPKVSNKFSHKKLKMWFCKYVFLDIHPPKTVPAIFKFQLFYTCECVCVPWSMLCLLPTKPKKGHQTPWTGVTGSCPLKAGSSARAQAPLSPEAPL